MKHGGGAVPVGLKGSHDCDNKRSCIQSDIDPPKTASNSMAGIFSTSRLFNKTALITGASGGIGAATAILFARAGANVIISARRKEQLAKVAEQARQANKEGQTGQGGKVFELVLDVSDRRSADSQSAGDEHRSIYLARCSLANLLSTQISSRSSLPTSRKLTSLSTMPGSSMELTTSATCEWPRSLCRRFDTYASFPSIATKPKPIPCSTPT